MDNSNVKAVFDSLEQRIENANFSNGYIISIKWNNKYKESEDKGHKIITLSDKLYNGLTFRQIKDNFNENLYDGWYNTERIRHNVSTNAEFKILAIEDGQMSLLTVANSSELFKKGLHPKNVRAKLKAIQKALIFDIKSKGKNE